MVKPTFSIMGIIDSWTAREVKAELSRIGNKDITIEIASPGGFVYPGIQIFNMIRNHEGHVTTYLTGLAASMASYIALAGDHVTAESNAVYMIHNARLIAQGDQHIMRKAMERLEGVSRLLGKEYVAKSGKTADQIQQMMDYETFLYGDEMKKEGFVDEIIQAKKDKPRKQAIAEAVLEIENCMSVICDSEKQAEDMKQLAACLDGVQDFEDIKIQKENEPEGKINGFNDSAALVDETWSKSESESRWRAHAGVKGADDLPNATYDKRFILINDSKSLTDRKFPIWDFKNGKEFVNIAAVRNGLARLPQSKGISPADKARIESVLNKYLDKFKKQQSKGVKKMDKDTLKREHPELFNSVIADGEKAERDRVEAHLTLGEATGAMDYAVKCIREGKASNEQAVQAHYMAEGMKKKDIDNRGDDNPDGIDTDTTDIDENQLIEDRVKNVMKYSKVKGQAAA